MPEDYISGKASSRDKARTWHGSAFIVESLLLLVFIAASVAIVVQMLGFGYSQGAQAQELSNAVTIASTAAEKFAANPSEKTKEMVYCESDSGSLKRVPIKGEIDKSGSVDVDGQEVALSDSRIYLVKRAVTSKYVGAGKLLEARITVTHNGQEVYAIDTSRYVSGNGDSAAAANNQNTSANAPKGESDNDEPEDEEEITESVEFEGGVD